MRTSRRVAVLLVASLASLTALATPALAGTFEGAPDREPLDITVPDANICGIVGVLHISGSTTTWTALDASGVALVKQITQQTATFTNPVNGKAITNTLAMAATDQGESPVGPDLIAVTTKYGGVEEWVRTADGTSLYKDRGFITLVHVLDDNGTPADPFDDVVVSGPSVVVDRGQHPGIEGVVAPCDLIAQALT